MTLDLAERYREYISCLNRQSWVDLKQFVSDDVKYNDDPLGLTSYQEMLVENYREIPDLSFEIGMLVVEREFVAARLIFNCTPTLKFLGLEVNGRKITFTENVFYSFSGDRISSVWSVIDKAAIESQILAQ